MNYLKGSTRESFFRNRFVIANYLLICLMISSLAVSIQQLIHVFSIDWEDNYFPYLGFCIGLIALSTRKATRDMTIFSKERISRILFEWILILLVLKILI
jgi:hypothetical protein